MKFIAHSIEETDDFAKQFSQKDFSVLKLYGDLGVGKTTFVKSLAKYLGITETIVSPTYSIIKEYDGPPRLIHMDLYRIQEEEELLAIGFEDYFDQTIVLIEWPEIAEDLLPEDSFSLTISQDGEKRIFEWEEE